MAGAGEGARKGHKQACRGARLHAVFATHASGGRTPASGWRACGGSHLDRGGEVPILGDDQPQLILRHRCQLHIRHARHGRVVYLREDGVVPEGGGARAGWGREGTAGLRGGGAGRSRASLRAAEMRRGGGPRGRDQGAGRRLAGQGAPQVVARLEPLDSDGPSVRLGQAHLEAAAVDDVKRLGRLSLLVHHLALGERPALRQRDRHGLEHLHQPRSLPLFGALAHRGGEGGGSIRPRNLVEDALVYGEHFHGSLGEDRGGAHLASLQKTGLAEEVARPEGGDLALAAVGAGHPHLARPAGDNIESVDGVALPKDVVAAAKRPREGGGHRLAVAVEGDGGAGLGARLAPQARCAAASLGGLVAAPTAAGGLRVAAPTAAGGLRVAASATGRASACGARAGRGRRVLVALHDCGWDAPRAPELLRLGRGSQHSHHLLDVPLSHLVPHVHAHPAAKEWEEGGYGLRGRACRTAACGCTGQPPTGSGVEFWSVARRPAAHAWVSGASLLQPALPGRRSSGAHPPSQLASAVRTRGP
eukprot:scaffold5386_cov98-Isochrysis_galbana.AAC.12